VAAVTVEQPYGNNHAYIALAVETSNARHSLFDRCVPTIVLKI